jgi:hypothetical protein
MLHGGDSKRTFKVIGYQAGLLTFGSLSGTPSHFGIVILKTVTSMYLRPRLQRRPNVGELHPVPFSSFSCAKTTPGELLSINT